MRGITTKWFPLTADRDLEWVVDNYVDVVAITPEVAANVGAAAALGATNDTATASFVANPASATTAALSVNFAPVYTPEKYGAVGDGVADDTSAVLAAFAAANAEKRVNGTYADPGARVVMKRRYKLTTLAAPIPVMCHLQASGAEVLAPAGYTGTVMAVGHETSGSVLQNAEVETPSVTGVTSATMGDLPAGSTGVTIRNLYTSRVRVGKIIHFETGLRVGGQSWGVAYNEIGWRTISYAKVCVSVKPLDAGGWSNQNTFIAGSCTGSSTWAGGRRASGTRALLLDGSGSNTVTGNTFLGCSFESDTFEHVIEVKNGYQNVWLGCRHEQGIAAADTTVSGDTFTATAHPLAVGEMVFLTGTTAPTGTFFDRPYYVVATTTNTFKISLKRGGTAITTTSSGTSVKYLRPQRVRFENATDNVIRNPMTPVTWLEVVESGTAAATAGNMIRYAQGETRDAYIPGSWPLNRARNRYSSGTNRPLWAAYPSTANPYEDPEGWTAALSDKGLHFGNSGAETAWLGATSTGALTHQRPADATSGVTYDIPSWRRIGAGTTLASGTTYNTNTRTTGTASLTGTSVGDYVVWSTTTGLPPRGLTISAQVTSTGTITYAIDNNTGSNITLASDVTLFFAAARRFL
ncbi:hypothetical protein J2X46_002674 [Nocardioides sp. BE266]|uniref:hypothetical protein n=1 Tax=Nocardioides sp. BE266 TaxID=2817725 RepID=UPI00285EECBA|nr:hypothetical protein [Nocardioides sp. BE266]MDR7253684.1 hypothetical protein [Nocardioides sp. BE266]